MNLEEAKKDLKIYVDEDEIYQDYKRNPNLIKSDFDQFCVNHCEAIDIVLKENELIEAKVIYEINKIWKDKIRAKINYIKSNYSQINGDYFLANDTIQVLQELLEEGENDEND